MACRSCRVGNSNYSSVPATIIPTEKKSGGGGGAALLLALLGGLGLAFFTARNQQKK